MHLDQDADTNTGSWLNTTYYRYDVDNVQSVTIGNDDRRWYDSKERGLENKDHDQGQDWMTLTSQNLLYKIKIEWYEG